MPPAKEIDALYGLPLDEFTNARNELARELRRQGRRDEAEEVASLRKPSLAAWVVNQLARQNTKDVEELIKAAAALRKGDADGDERFRRAVDELVRAARELLAKGGRGTDAVVQEVATTLRATAAVAPDELTEGRLTAARPASGFDALAGSVPPKAKRPAARARAETTKERKRPSVDRAAVEAARRELDKAREEARRLRREAAQAEREARRAREAAERAERRVEDRKAA
ncbi:MAG TPA: hypothetical protein VJM06_02230, partial [Gaiellaceae bacterium]|nr:hypothetical protein [Gaiellaceae bacterium]